MDTCNCVVRCEQEKKIKKALNTFLCNHLDLEAKSLILTKKKQPSDCQGTKEVAVAEVQVES